MVASGGVWTPTQGVCKAADISFQLPPAGKDETEEEVFAEAEDGMEAVTTFLQSCGLKSLNDINRGNDSRASTDWNAMHWALHKGRHYIMKELHDNPHFEGVNHLATHDVSPLFSAIAYGDNEAVKLLLSMKRYTAINTPDYKGLQPFILAVQLGDVEITKALVKDSRVEKSCRTPVGGTPLHVALSQGHVGVTELLIHHCGGEMLNARNGIGQTALHVAVNAGTAQALLDCQLFKAANDLDASLRSPLHTAALHNLPAVVAVLLEHDRYTEVDTLDRKGCSALHLAVFGSKYKVVEALLKPYSSPALAKRKSFVDMDVKDNKGNTAQDLAKMNAKNEAVVELLERVYKQKQMARTTASKDRSTTWMVTPSREQGGIIVRSAKSLQSPAFQLRLAVGAVIEELSVEGNRMKYKKISGSGPETGWVNISFNNKQLLKNMEGTSRA
jgi:ankyrin repeat protein